MCVQYFGHGWYWNCSGIVSFNHSDIGGKVVTLNHTFAEMGHSTPRFVVSPAVREATRRLVLTNSTCDTCTAVDVLLGLDVVSAVLTQVACGSIGLLSSNRCWDQFGFVMGSAPISLCCSLSCECPRDFNNS